MQSSLTALLEQSMTEEGWIGSWSPGIGDPTFVGWFTVFAYAVTSYLCLRVYRRLPGANLPRGASGYVLSLVPLLLALKVDKGLLMTLTERQRMSALWLSLAIVLALLGINKQLDLQTAFTEVGRIMAHDEGWYAYRRYLQVTFILGVVLFGLWVFRAVVNLASGSRGRARPVLAGTIFIICFVTIRAASFHHIDSMISTKVGGVVNVNWIVELGGIAFVAFGAWREARRLRATGPGRGAPRPGSARPGGAPPSGA